MWQSQRFKELNFIYLSKRLDNYNSPNRLIYKHKSLLELHKEYEIIRLGNYLGQKKLLKYLIRKENKIIRKLLKLHLSDPNLES